MLAIDQYGQRIYIPGKHPRKELLEKLGASHASKIYMDSPSGETLHVGYVIAGLWLTLYSHVEA